MFGFYIDTSWSTLVLSLRLRLSLGYDPRHRANVVDSRQTFRCCCLCTTHIVLHVEMYVGFSSRITKFEVSHISFSKHFPRNAVFNVHMLRHACDIVGRIQDPRLKTYQSQTALPVNICVPLLSLRSCFFLIVLVCVASRYLT